MPAPEIIHQLVTKFAENREAYRSGKYNEARLRQEFLDKFFEALGWDIYNKNGVAPEYSDVIIEDSLEIEGAAKSPDYVFKIGRERKFYVEAKKPSVNIEYDIHPAYQLRRYAWNAHLSLSILTDFEEFAVYNCKNKPSPTDSAGTGRDKLYHYTDYVEKWDEIAAVFSKDAVWKGAFDRFAESTKGKQGTTEVDDAILKDIEAWRLLLARNIALRNPQVADEHQLNYAVQMTIDRILFLRICEDRGIEPEEQLKTIAAAASIYTQLVELFRRADLKYNSGLFHFNKEKGSDSPTDAFTPGLKIDDKVLKEIITSIYYPCPYIFKEIPVEILGQVYEQFLGKVIRLTAGHQAKVEEKPEVRKAGGVYYTPKYIVDYIVENTVGKLLEGKTPLEAAELKIVDPACGSGSFLLGAYQHLLDWHLNWYTANEPEQWAKGKTPALVPAVGSGSARSSTGGPAPSSTGSWKLTTAKKKDILVNNIHGVDIDAQAVEVTKLSLLLKVLEGESGQLSLGFERVLPDLSRNIQCGNSLIGPDYYADQQMTMFDSEEQYRVNAFDWHAAFPQVFIRGGFDAVIGNPPYGASLEVDSIKYLKNKFFNLAGSDDSFDFFLIQGNNLLCSKGRLGMIIPSSWLTGEKYFKSRHTLVLAFEPVIAYAMPFDVFESAYIDTAIVIFARDKKITNTLIHYFPKKEKLTFIKEGIGTQVEISSIRNDEFHRLTNLLSENNISIVQKMKSVGYIFGDWFEIQRGVQPYSRSKHTEKQIKNRFLHSSEPLSAEYIPELQGNEMSRYYVSKTRKSYIHYCDQIASNRPMKMFQNDRLVIRRLLTRKFRLQASEVSETLITTDNVLNAVPISEKTDIKFALGILNSRITSWLYVNSSLIAQKDDFPQVYISALKALPIPRADIKQHDRMVRLVERMLDLHKRIPATPQEQERLARDIASTDREIDNLVYQLYGLTEEEIKIVEGA
jgi:hypothetical protein